MPEFRKRPVVVEARQVTEANRGDIAEWAGGRVSKLGSAVVIHTLEGDMFADPGDWVICGVEGEFYPCKPTIFEATYEPI
jgi:hypothetical protein